MKLKKILNVMPEAYEQIDKFLSFVKEHNAECDLQEPILPFYYALKVVRELGYNIEVAEISKANKVIGSIKGKDWHRTHQYRWEIVYWDENGTMISLTYSDNNNDCNFFNSEEAAQRNAIDYIIDNYKKLEQI